jgi:hypothetical protein
MNIFSSAECDSSPNGAFNETPVMGGMTAMISSEDFAAYVAECEEDGEFQTWTLTES